MHPRLMHADRAKRIARGLNAGTGGAVGKAIFSSAKAAELGKGGKGEAIILVSQETTPDDIKGMLAAQGVLTEKGGMTSHAALVARGFGSPTVAGCSEMPVDGHNKRFTVGDSTVKEGAELSLNGTVGEVILGCVPVEGAKPTGES